MTDTCRVQHPRAVLDDEPDPPSNVHVSFRRNRPVDEAGYFTVRADNLRTVLTRLAEAYDVSYTGAMLTLQAGDVPETADVGDSGDTTDADLDEMSHSDLKARFDELGGDRDDVDLRRKDAVRSAVRDLQED